METEKPKLRGWDDESVWFDTGGPLDSPDRNSFCIGDEPELLAHLLAICADYFRRKKLPPDADQP